MERRKQELKYQLERLRQECELTVDLLNKLLETSTTHANAIQMLNDKDFHLYSKYFVAVSQFQHLSQQKILELNVDLEEHILSQQLLSIEQFKFTNSSSNTYGTVRNSLTNLMPVTPVANDTNSNDIHKLETLVTENASKLTDFELLTLDSTHLINNVHLEKEKLTETHNTNVLEVENYSQSIDQDCNSSNLQIRNVKEVHETVQNEEIQENLSGLEDISSDSLICSETLSGVSTTDSKTSDANNDQQVKVEVEENKVELAASLDISKSLKLLSMTESGNDALSNTPVASIPAIALKFAPKQEQIVTQNENNTNSSNSSSRSASKTEKRKKKKKEKAVAAPSKETQDKKRQEIKYAEIKNRTAPKVGDVCMIGYAETPVQFFIQVADEVSNLIDEFETQLASINSNTPFVYTTKTKTLNKFGKYYSVPINGYWYRVEVLDWMLHTNDESENKVFVQLIDYGSCFMVDYTKLRPLPLDFYYPRIAQPCHLPYLYPPGSTTDNILMEWDDNSKEIFWKTCGDLNKSVFKILHALYCPEKNSFEIDLVPFDDELGDTIGEILKQSGAAVEIINGIYNLDAVNDLYTPIVNHRAMMNQIQKAQGVHEITPEMSKNEMLEAFFKQNQIGDEAATINEAVLSYDPRDEAETCKNLRRDGTCYKGNTCKFRHNHLKDGFTTDKEAIYHYAFADLDLPNSGDHIRIVITRIVSIQCFYAQLCHTESDSVRPCTQLIKIMNTPDRQSNYKKFKHIPSISQLVIVKFWNKKWYRGLIRSIESSTGQKRDAKFEVFLVDFGEIIEVSISDLRVMIPEFLYVPFQAIECRLHNIKHRTSLDELEEQNYFTSQYLGKTLKARVIASSRHLEVLLENDKGEDVGLQMISEGYGESNTEHSFPVENTMVLID